MKLLDKFYKAWQNDSPALHISLLVLLAIVWGATCGLWGMSGGDEPRYTLIAKELIDNGNVFLLTLSGEPYDQKPPLIFWLFAISMKLCGGEVSSFAPRVVSAIFALITLGATYVCGRRIINAKTGLYAAFILATFPVFINHVPRAKLDMVFAAFVTLAVAAVITRKNDNGYIGWLRALALWGGLAGAFFVKGPLALLIVLIFIVLYAIFDGRGFWRTILRLRFFWGLAFVFVLIGLWLGIEVYLVGPEFVTNQVGGETIERVTQGAHANPIWFYFLHIFEIIGFWFFGLVLAFYIMFKRKAPRIPQLKLWAFWFVPGFIVLCLATGKRIAYPLPLLPPLAIFIAYYVHAASLKADTHKLFAVPSFIASRLSVAGGALLFIISIFVYIKIGLVWNYEFYIARWSLVLAGLAGLMLVVAGLRQGRARQGLGALCGTLIFAFIVINFVVNVAVYPATDVHNTSRFFSQNLTLMYPELLHKPLGATTVSDDATPMRNAGSYRFHVYGKYKIAPLVYNRNMFAEPNAALPDYILMDEMAFDQLIAPPEQGGYSLVFWDTVEYKYKLRLLRRNVIPAGTAEAATTEDPPLLLAYGSYNQDAPDGAKASIASLGMLDLNRDKCVLPQGLLLFNGVLRPYESQCRTAGPELVGVLTVNHGLARVYSVNMQKGFAGNAYAVNWLIHNGPKFPAENNLLALTNIPAKKPLYGRAFNELIFNKIMSRNKIKAVFFMGPGADLAATKMVNDNKIKVSDETIMMLWLDFSSRPPLLKFLPKNNSDTESYPLAATQAVYKIRVYHYGSVLEKALVSTASRILW